jgi:hypothetical protein
MAMPQPGDLITAFSVQPGRCFRMIYDHKLQATHCLQPPAWKGVWRDAKGKSWYAEACREHAPKAKPSTGGTTSAVSLLVGIDEAKGSEW